MKRYAISTIHALMDLPGPDKRRAAEVGMNPFTFSRVKGRLIRKDDIRPITLCPFKAIGLYGVGIYHIIKSPGEEEPKIDPVKLSFDIPPPLRALPLLTLSNHDHTLHLFLLSSYSTYIWLRKEMLTALKGQAHTLYDNLFYLDYARIKRFFDFRPAVREIYLGEAGEGTNMEEFFLRERKLKEFERHLIETLIKHPGVSDDALGKLMNTTRYRASTTRARLREEGYLHETYWVSPMLLGASAIAYIHLDIDPALSLEDLKKLSQEVKFPPSVFFSAEDPLRVALLVLADVEENARELTGELKKYYPRNLVLATAPSFCVFNLQSPETCLTLHYGGV